MYQIFNLEFNNITLPISYDIPNYQGNIFTLIIGKNGLGKSRLLTSLIYNYIDEKDLDFFYRTPIKDNISKIKATKKPKKIIAHTNSQFNKFPQTYYSIKRSSYVLIGSQSFRTRNSFFL